MRGGENGGRRFDSGGPVPFGLFLMLGIGGFLMEFVVPRVPFLARLADKLIPDDDFEEDDE